MFTTGAYSSGEIKEDLWTTDEEKSASVNSSGGQFSSLQTNPIRPQELLIVAKIKLIMITGKLGEAQ